MLHISYWKSCCNSCTHLFVWRTPNKGTCLCSKETFSCKASSGLSLTALVYFWEALCQETVASSLALLRENLLALQRAAGVGDIGMRGEEGIGPGQSSFMDTFPTSESLELRERPLQGPSSEALLCRENSGQWGRCISKEV